MSRLTDAFICMDSKVPTYGYMMHCGSTEYSNYPLFGDNHTSHEERIFPGHDITVTGMIHNADSVADYARTSQYKASSSSLPALGTPREISFGKPFHVLQKST
ncbi:hypothetical protein CVT26_015779 [Gymnopilus dilepis]|uniref:Uncharacterized protein n=1 Tax=Gymnopilus dilepis TaxID=231916 RepID=A0A409YD87_9AGAR|nr:hypothetical protein CVT26_015779 [Gymnopilus dilepis]